MDSTQLAELRTWAERLRVRSEHDESKAAARAILLLIRELEAVRGEVRAERTERVAQREDRRPPVVEPEAEEADFVDRPPRRMWADEEEESSGLGLGGGASSGLRRWVKRALGDDEGDEGGVWDDERGGRRR